MIKALYRSAVLVCFLASAALADHVLLRNGDRLTGSIVKSDGKSVVIQTEFAGTVTIALEAVAQFSADAPVYLTLADGQVLVGTVAPAGNKVDVKTTDAGTVSVGRESIKTIRSKAEETLYQAELERLRNPGLADLWSGTADAGVSLASGNSKTATFSTAVTAARATTRDKISVYLTTLYASNSTTGVSVTTANSRRGGGRYDVNLNPRTFAFGTGDLENDEFQKLDLRLTLGGGMGWHGVRTERMTFDLFGGGAMNREYFSTGLRRTSAEVLIGEESTHKLNARSSFKQKAVLFPNLSETGEFRLTFDASAVTSLNRWLGWHVTFSNRYLSNPLPGTKANDVLLTTGLRVTFGR